MFRLFTLFLIIAVASILISCGKQEDKQFKQTQKSKPAQQKPSVLQLTAEEWYEKGSVLHDGGLYAEAISCYDKALEINPSHVDALNDKGSALHDLGRYSEAIICFDRVLQINPMDYLALYNKGYCLGKLGRHTEAITCFNRALKINPTHAKSWLNKGVASVQLGQNQEAISCFKKALELDPYGTTGASARKNLPLLESYKREINISYTWEGATNRCIGAKASSNDVILGDAKKIGIGGNKEEGYYVEVEEVHYAPDGSGRVIYRSKSKFRIGYRGTKIEETPISGRKVYELFEEWPMGS